MKGGRVGSHGWKTFISLWAIRLSLNVERTWEMEQFTRQLTRSPAFHESSSIVCHRIFKVWSKRTGRKLRLARGYC